MQDDGVTIPEAIFIFIWLLVVPYIVGVFGSIIGGYFSVPVTGAIVGVVSTFVLYGFSLIMMEDFFDGK